MSINAASQQALANLAAIEVQMRALKVFLAAKKKRARAGQIQDWGEVGDLGRLRNALEEVSTITS